MMRGGERYPNDWDQRRKIVYKRDNYTCQACGSRGGPYGDLQLHAHHVTPISQGGTHDYTNLATVCHRCHEQIHDHAIPTGGGSNSRRSSQPSGTNPDKAQSLQQIARDATGTHRSRPPSGGSRETEVVLRDDDNRLSPKQIIVYGFCVVLLITPTEYPMTLWGLAGFILLFTAGFPDSNIGKWIQGLCGLFLIMLFNSAF